MNKQKMNAFGKESEAEYGITNVEQMPMFSFSMDEEPSQKEKALANHRTWLKSVRHERPNPTHPYRIGVYIRYFNQTKYDNYLDYHTQQFKEIIGNCPRWTLVDFYIDEGNVAPLMENAPEWSRLISDCFEGKIDLIITQKVSNVSRRPEEVTLCSRLLATQEHPVGFYFISEDIFTLATYYQDDIRDPQISVINDLPEMDGNFMGGLLNE